MSISGIFVYQFRPTILSKLNRTISSSDENSIRRVYILTFRIVMLQQARMLISTGTFRLFVMCLCVSCSHRKGHATYT